MLTPKDRLLEIRGNVEGSDIFDTILFCFNEYEEYLSEGAIRNEIMTTIKDMIDCYLEEKKQADEEEV